MPEIHSIQFWFQNLGDPAPLIHAHGQTALKLCVLKICIKLYNLCAYCLPGLLTLTHFQGDKKALKKYRH